MTFKTIERITGYHAHIYFDADSEADAQAVRDTIDARFVVTLGRWHRGRSGRIRAGCIRCYLRPNCSPVSSPGWL